MIKKLKYRFVILSMTSLLILLAIMTIAMNIINYSSIVSSTDDILTLLSHNRGRFPGFEADNESSVIIDQKPIPNNDLPPHMSPEVPYESRFFSVLLSEDGSVLFTDVSHIASIDAKQAEIYARLALSNNRDRAFIDTYRYIKRTENNAIRIIFLDCEQRIESFERFLYTSIIIALAGFIIVFFIIFFFAERIIRPISESYEKQKRFITDAGHEIKTPLTVINTNIDILEMEIGKNESLSDIQQQTKRLTKLTNDLVSLTRMEETGNSIPMIEFPISEVVATASEDFRALATAQNKAFDIQVQPLLTVKGNDSSITHLVSILLDNALKYSPANSEINLNLYEHNRSIVLQVINQTKMHIEESELNRVFERFYRLDSSRNSQTGGNGIGLSIARAIVSAHGGKITATIDKSERFSINVTIPL
ncbi:MAG: GHKL domain-containing protein [Clostridia bacterium]|nr:GHKL domain-containing protein [Clostridia bacterium]